MAITYQNSQTASSSVAVASLAFPSATVTNGRDIVIKVSLGSTGSSVSSITDSNSKLTSKTLQVSVNKTNVRTEIWTAHVNGTTGATVITVNITGGNTTMAQTYDEYSGVNAFGNTATDTETSRRLLDVSAATGFASSFVSVAFGMLTQSGDTVTAIYGTQRASVIPAATTVSMVSYDNASVAECVLLPGTAMLSTAREQAICALEIRSSSSAHAVLSSSSTTPTQDNQLLPLTGTSAPPTVTATYPATIFIY